MQKKSNSLCRLRVNLFLKTSFFFRPFVIKYGKLILRERVDFMELKKCARCGCFFASNSDVCCNCEVKDKHDIYTLNDYIVNSPTVGSVDSLAYNTGVSAKNIARFIEHNDISNF